MKKSKQIFKIENLRKDVEDIKKNQVKSLELRNETAKIKSSVMGSTTEWRGNKKGSVNLKMEE